MTRVLPGRHSLGRRTGDAAPLTMKAVVHDGHGSADVLRFRTVERPAPAADRVIVRVGAAGLDRDAWHTMTGRPYFSRFSRRARTAVLGSDLAGVVESVGAAVHGLAPGDAVFGFGTGTFAEYAAARPDDLIRMPAHLAYAQAAAVPGPGLTALQALCDEGGLVAGQHVLIVGASGGVGTFAVQIAKALGARVTGVCSTAKTGLVRSLGADHVIDYTAGALAAGGGRHYDLILDLGGARKVGELRRLLTPRGTLVLVGNEGGGRWFGDTGRAWRAKLLSVFTGQRLGPMIATRNTADLATLRALIDDGAVRPVVDRSCSLSGLAGAMRDLEAGRVRGRIVVAL